MFFHRDKNKKESFRSLQAIDATWILGHLEEGSIQGPFPEMRAGHSETTEDVISQGWAQQSHHYL